MCIILYIVSNKLSKSEDPPEEPRSSCPFSDYGPLTDVDSRIWRHGPSAAENMADHSTRQRFIHHHQ